MNPQRVRLSDIKRPGRPEIIPLFSNVGFIDSVKHSDYLYEMTYDCLDYDFAYQYFKDESHLFVPTFTCSSVRKGQWYGRNFDWFYNHDCDFVIKTNCDGVIPSIGVAGGMSQLNKDSMETSVEAKYLKLLPFRTLDGVNKDGVFINTNVIPDDKGKIIHTDCTEEKEYDMFILMWPRFVLDHFSTALEAIEYAQKHISFYQYGTAADHGYAIHFMIGDTEHTYVMEIIDNKVDYIEKNYMTNFNVIGTEFNENDLVYTPGTQDLNHNAMITNKITAHGTGLERWNLIAINYPTLNSKEEIANLMHNVLNYNNAYTGDIGEWYTEGVGTYEGTDFTVATSPYVYEQYIMPVMREQYAHRNRDTVDQTVWHTTHSSIYDLQNKKIYIYDSTEDGVEHEFSL